MSTIDLENLNKIDTLASHVGIEFVTLERDRLQARMPVDKRTKQAFGIMHGGASGILVETLASIGSVLNIDKDKEVVFGVELNCRHVKAVSDGWVLGTAIPIKLGRNIHFWDVEIVKEGQPSFVVCKGSCTLFVRKK